MPPRSSNPLADHFQRLQDEQERIKREMAEAEKALRQKPKATRAKTGSSPRVRINANMPIDLPRPMDHLFRDDRPSMQRRGTVRRRKPEARIAQVKFLLLCLFLAALVLFVWRNLPG